MNLRPYQEEAISAIEKEWYDKAHKHTLLVLPTGTGKTVVFAKLAEKQVRNRNKGLILAHRGELLEQAQDKIKVVTGMSTALEKAESSAVKTWYPLTVGSVQSLAQDKRLNEYSENAFDFIIVDEAHHCLSDTYQKVLNHFPKARVLGVTATPDRGDHRTLAEFFDSLAYEYTIPQAVHEGYLCKLKAQMIPLQLDLNSVSVQNGDFAAGSLGTALEPYLEQIADEMKKYSFDRKTVVFLPLISTSQKFCKLLNERGFRASEVNGESPDRKQIIEDFAKGKYNVLCNSMLLTEGWDCPAVDCVVVLRPTKVRSLYCLDEQTEILTESGWKSDVQIGEKVAAFDPETTEIKFLPAIAKVRRPLNEDEYFCSIKGPSVDIRVTNKHRMLFDNKRKLGWKFSTAERIASLRDGCRLPVAGNGNFSGVPLTDDELRFIGWVMTDGSINKANNAISITQGLHQPWCNDIQSCIEGCGFKYNKFVRKRDSKFNSTSDAQVWTISKGKPRGRDSHLRGWGALEPYLSKDFSLNLMNMTEKQFAVLLEAIHLGDGAKQAGQSWTRRSYHIYTGNITYANRLQIAAILHGHKANVSTYPNGENGEVIYCIHIKKKDFVNVGSVYDGRPTWNTEKHTDEMCWCVENQLGTLVTRRNGKVAIVGNCQMIGRGTRPCEGKEDLLILDFLWMSEKHSLCRPATLLARDEAESKAMTKAIENSEEALDLEECQTDAERDAAKERELALAKELQAMRQRKRKLVDPLQYASSIQDFSILDNNPFSIGLEPVTKEQRLILEKNGIYPDDIQYAYIADNIIKSLNERYKQQLASAKQIRFLEGRGFRNVGTWSNKKATKLIAMIAKNGWQVPRTINPEVY